MARLTGISSNEEGKASSRSGKGAGDIKTTLKKIFDGTKRKINAKGRGNKDLKLVKIDQ